MLQTPLATGEGWGREQQMNQNVVTLCTYYVLVHGLASSREADACQRGVMHHEFLRGSGPESDH